MSPTRRRKGSAKRIVVTGASGNVGTSVVRALSEDPAVGEVIGIARRRPEWTVDKVEWVSADVAHDDLVPIFAGADAVIHLAWLLQPARAPWVTWQANVIGSVRVFDAVVAAGVPSLLYASSVGAYSPGPKDHPVDEGWPTHGWPAASYTREKAYLERMLDTFEGAHPDVRVVRMRPAFLFQRHAATEQRRLFAGPFLPQRLVRSSLVPVVPDLPGLRVQALHTADAAEAYRLAVLGDVRGAFNLAADPVVDSRLLAEVLGAKVVRLPVWAVKGPLAAAWRLHLTPADPNLFDAVLRLPLMDTSRARTELGWKPLHSARTAIEEFLTGLLRAESRVSYGQIIGQGRDQKPPVELHSSTLSDWTSGRTVPDSPERFMFVVKYLSERAGRRGVKTHPISWWEELRQRAREEARARHGGAPQDPAGGAALSASDRRS